MLREHGHEYGKTARSARLSRCSLRAMRQSPDSETVTEGIRVHAAAFYLNADSDPASRQFVFAYRVIITNEGDEPVKLLSRHWIILDADNRRQEVRGSGVVGQKPRLESGERFEYVSGCALPTAWGTMEGTYRMRRDDESEFDIEIGRFFLVSDDAKRGSG